MTFAESLEQDFKAALKARDELKTAVLRMIKTGVKNREVELRRKAEDQEILAVISTQLKQRRDSIEQFEKGGRQDLADREKAEAAVLEAYLPKQMDRSQIEEALSGIIEELGVSSPKETGLVMKTMMSRFAGQVDGKLVSELLKAKLTGK